MVDLHCVKGASRAPPAFLGRSATGAGERACSSAPSRARRARPAWEAPGETARVFARAGAPAAPAPRRATPQTPPGRG
eukprot:scaffold5343_cov215-Prasinococcus_capsulatus_cf.AAC.2